MEDDLVAIHNEAGTVYRFTLDKASRSRTRAGRSSSLEGRVLDSSEKRCTNQIRYDGSNDIGKAMGNSDQDRWHDWFFRSHSPAELNEWTSRMRFFRFHRAIGGFANDGDTLRCAVRVETEDELIAVAKSLGLSLHELPPDEPQPILGKDYTIAEIRRFRSRMEPFPRFEQLGWVMLASVTCLARVWGSRLELDLSGAAGNSFEVSEADVANAIRVEQLLLPIGDRMLMPGPDNEYYFVG